MLSDVELMRRNVVFALTKQPNKSCAALTGDGHSVVSPSWFEGKVSPTWLPDIKNDLVQEFFDLEDNNGNPVASARGVSLIDFVNWIGGRVQECDPNFSWEDKIGRGARAHSIQSALFDWVGNETAPSCA